MIDYIDTPSPYIIGMKYDHYKKLENTRIKNIDYVIIFDIDNNEYLKNSKEIIEFPHKLMKETSNNIKRAFSHIKESNKEYECIMKTLEIKYGLLKLYFNIIGDFDNYYTISRNPYLKENTRREFKFDEYLKGIIKETFLFMKEFIKTNLFTTFIENMCDYSTINSQQFMKLYKTIKSDNIKEVANAFRTVMKSAKHVMLQYFNSLQFST